MRFFVCEKCGKMVAVTRESKCEMLQCCNQAMVEVKANTQDAAVEKHVPQYEVKGNTVEVVVGSVEHPMADVHYIEWIMLETNKGNAFRYLKPEMAPKASFALAEGEEVVAVYAFCNLHGLWKK